jgi:uncharacterized protein YqjF (DUF2071 family)
MARPFLSAQWRHLVMLNYEVDPGVLRPLVPRSTELDAWNNRYFVSLVGFLMLDTRILGLPIPRHQNFEEVNLRYYVRHKGPEGWRRGVVFVKEVVPHWAIAAMARWLYNENYIACSMTSRVILPNPTRGLTGAVEYCWGGPQRLNSVRADFEGIPSFPLPGSEEEFITQHYWGYVKQRDGGTAEYRVAHPQWRVWRATASHLDCDLPAFYGGQYAAAMSQMPSSAFVAEGSAVVVHQGCRIHRG